VDTGNASHNAESGNARNFGSFGGRQLNATGNSAQHFGNGDKKVDVNNNINFTKNIDNSKKIAVYKDNHVTNNVDNSKEIDVYKPVTINNNIDNSKNIDVYKPVSVTNNIGASKNINTPLCSKHT
jgi:hypothetical protein